MTFLCAALIAASVSPGALLKQEGVSGIVAVLDVRSGELLASAGNIDGERVLPLSLVKVMLAASLLEHGIDAGVEELIVSGSDQAARDLAVRLRKEAGGRALLTDVHRYGFRIALPENVGDAEWGDTFSLGEANFQVTALEVARFFRLVATSRLLKPSTQQALQRGMLEAVERGTAKDIRGRVVAGKIGGKTGTGPGHVGPDSNGWFAGLIFDARGEPRFAFATYVRKGGPGGGTAARISADLANALLKP